MAAALLIAGPAQVASAAPAAGTITACFKYGTTPYNGMVLAQKSSGGSWVTTATLQNAANGCRTWSVAAGSTFRFLVRANYTYATIDGAMHGYYLIGTSPAILSVSGVNKSVTTGLVRTDLP